MPIPPDVTLDPPALPEGTKFDPDATYTWDHHTSTYAYWAVVEGDGSRRLIGWKSARSHAQIPDAFPGSDAYFVHRNFSEANFGHRGIPDQYLAYDWTITTDTVNQVPDVIRWESHLCGIAHDVDQFNIDTSEFRRPDTFKTVPVGSHSAETQIRNQNTLQVFRSMIGDALRRLDGWAAIDPTRTGENSWTDLREGIRAIIEDKVCQACEHHYSAREFARLHDYSAWRTALDHRRELDDIGSVVMRVPMIDRSSVPWSPHPTENLAWFGGTQVDEGWRRAVEWYDEALHRYDRTYAERYPTT